MTIVTYGRPSSLPRVDFGFIAPGQLRGVTFNAATQHMWVYQLAIRGGKYTTEDPDNVTARVAIYAVDGSMNPAARLGYSAAMTITTVMNDIAGGADNAAAVEASTGPLATAIPLSAGVRYHLAVLGTVGSLGHAMQAASRITADNERFYNRSGLSQPPPNPFGSYTSSTEGHLVIWAIGDDNVAPEQPSNLSPSGNITETAPTFSADFADDNENRGDYLNQFRIQVRRVSDLTSFWNTTLTASGAEQTADAFSRAYAGTTLVRGTAYEWRTQMSDHFGEWSAWTAWTAFTPVALGYVTLDQDPTGKIEDNTPDFEGRWTHQDGDDMTHAQARVLNAAGTTILQTGAEYDLTDVASSASPGTSFTIPWASAGLTTLAWGTGYQYQIRGKDEDGLWSDWSAARTFNTNAAPSVPTGLSPNSTLFTITDYPLLTCLASDADDTIGTGFVVTCRIKDDAGAVIATEDMTYNSGTGKWEFQTTATELATFDTYKWDAYSYDGTLYSGEQTVEGNAVKSAEATFTYVDGISVTTSSPTEDQVLTSSDLTVTWNVVGGTQVSWAISVYDADGVEVYAETSVSLGLSPTLTTYTISDSPAILNGGEYTVVVAVLSATLDVGVSAPVPFTVAYTPPDTVANFAAETVKFGTDIWESGVRLTWDQTGYGTDVWQEYTITRTAESGPDAGTVILARLSSPSSVVFIDYLPASGHEYIYSITQSILEGVDTIISVPATASATVTLGGVVLCSTASPATLRTTLRHTRDRDFNRKIDEAVYVPLSGEEPTTVRSSSRIREPDFMAQIFDDAAATAAVRRDELEAIDSSAHTLCYRDNHGRKLFCTMSKYRLADRVPDWYEADLGLRAERFVEGAV
jgi:hypothetical protein